MNKKNNYFYLLIIYNLFYFILYKFIFNLL